jgi:hypothetical protein
MAGDGRTDQLREQPPPAACPKGPAFPAEASAGAMTGKTVAAAGLRYSGDRELDDQPGHACSSARLRHLDKFLAAPLPGGVFGPDGTGARALLAANDLAEVRSRLDRLSRSRRIGTYEQAVLDRLEGGLPPVKAHGGDGCRSATASSPWSATSPRA